MNVTSEQQRAFKSFSTGRDKKVNPTYEISSWMFRKKKRKRKKNRKNFYQLYSRR